MQNNYRKWVRLMAQIVVYLGIFSVALFIISGCTSLFSPPGSAINQSSNKQDACCDNRTVTVSSDKEPLELTTLQSHFAWVAIMKSPEFAAIKDKLLQHQPTAVARFSDNIGMVFDLQSQGKEAKNQYGVKFNPYVIFLLSPSLDKVVDVITCRPNLTLMTVQLTFSRHPTENRRVHFSSCVVGTIERMKSSIPQPRSSADAQTVVTPKRMCEPGLTYPKTVCTCTEVVPGHMDWNCFSTCSGACTVLDGGVVARAACEAACAAGCYVPAYCAELECVTLYPCP